MHIRRALVVALVGLLATACGGDDAKEQGTSTKPAANTVTMKLITFRPADLTIEVGEKVTWKQTDAGVHTVTSGTVEQGAAGVTTTPDAKFDSGDVKTDETFSFTFDEAGTYPYFCAVHPATMRGEVTVNP